MKFSRGSLDTRIRASFLAALERRFAGQAEAADFAHVQSMSAEEKLALGFELAEAARALRREPVRHQRIPARRFLL